MRELYISVDCETDGPVPGTDGYSMLSIGAVAAVIKDGKTGELEPLNHDTLASLRFYAELKPISANYISEAAEVGTFNNLPADSDAETIRNYLYEFGETPEAAMTRFVKWCFELKAEYNVSLVFAGYPLGFDWMFTYWYLISYAENGGQVFGFSRHLDMKTYYAATYDKLIGESVKSRMPKHLLKSKSRHTHNAVDDAAGQADMLVNLLYAAAELRKA